MCVEDPFSQIWSHYYIHTVYALLLIGVNYTLAPSAAVNVTSHTISSTSIMVTWQPPITPNGIVRSYRIEFTTRGVADNTYTVNTSIVINMLEKFTTYQIQLFATTVAEGSGSIIVSATTDEDSKFIIMCLKF